VPTSDQSLIVLLDANVLAKPVTRTLVLRCAPSGYTAVWSATAETEAARHLSGRQTPLTTVRDMIGMDLSPTGTTPGRFAATSPDDRQILADAEAAGATFLLTEDVDDFATNDLRLVGVSVVNPDLFLAERTERGVYRRALDVMASGMKNPSRTSVQLHAAIARQHPRLFAKQADLFDVEPGSTGHREPSVLFRGAICLRCLTPQPVDLPAGLCAVCV